MSLDKRIFEFGSGCLLLVGILFINKNSYISIGSIILSFCSLMYAYHIGKEDVKKSRLELFECIKRWR